MLSRDQEYDVTSGSEVVLDCEFHMDTYRQALFTLRKILQSNFNLVLDISFY